MTLWKSISERFREEEDGAVTADWVVVTAAVALLSVPLLSAVRTAVQNGTDSVATEMEENVSRE